MSDFKPPKPSTAFIGLAKFLLPFYLKFVERLSFRFSESAGRPVDFLKGKKVAILINHSDRQDPLLLIALAKYMNEEFYCIVARESFDGANGLLGWAFQKFGCFSVDRGTTDFKSIHTMRKILSEGDKKLIVFPEGEVTGNDHIVHDICPSIMHIFLNAQKGVAEKDANESVWILPVGISYTLETKLRASVDKTLTEVERQLEINRNHRIDAATRAMKDVGALLRKLSEQYEFDLPEHEPHHEQVRLLARHICERVGTAVGSEIDQELSNEQLLHSLRSDVSKLISSKDHDLVADASEHLEWFSDFDRVERLLILQRVLNQPTSAIQICRITDFLELEVCGRMTAKGQQLASVYIGTPIEVMPFLQEYESDKNSAVENLRDAVQEGLQSALDNTHNQLKSDTSANTQREPSLVQ